MCVWSWPAGRHRDAMGAARRDTGHCCSCCSQGQETGLQNPNKCSRNSQEMFELQLTGTSGCPMSQTRTTSAPPSAPVSQPQSSSLRASGCRAAQGLYWHKKPQRGTRTSSKASLLPALPAPNSHSVQPKMKSRLSTTLIHSTVTCTSLSSHFSLPWTDEKLHGKNIHEQLQSFSSFFLSALEGKQ